MPLDVRNGWNGCRTLQTWWCHPAASRFLKVLHAVSIVRCFTYGSQKACQQTCAVTLCLLDINGLQIYSSQQRSRNMPFTERLDNSGKATVKGLAQDGPRPSPSSRSTWFCWEFSDWNKVHLTREVSTVLVWSFADSLSPHAILESPWEALGMAIVDVWICLNQS